MRSWLKTSVSSNPSLPEEVSKLIPYLQIDWWCMNVYECHIVNIDILDTLYDRVAWGGVTIADDTGSYSFTRTGLFLDSYHAEWSDYNCLALSLFHFHSHYFAHRLTHRLSSLAMTTDSMPTGRGSQAQHNYSWCNCLHRICYLAILLRMVFMMVLAWEPDGLCCRRLWQGSRRAVASAHFDTSRWDCARIGFVYSTQRSTLQAEIVYCRMMLFVSGGWCRTGVVSAVVAPRLTYHLEVKFWGQSMGSSRT